MTFSVITSSDGRRPDAGDRRDVFFFSREDVVSRDVSASASTEYSYAFPDVFVSSSPPAHVGGFHTTTLPQPGTSNALTGPPSSFSSNSGHLSLGGTYATRCVGGARSSAGDVSTFHEDVSTKKGSSALGKTNACASASHAARSLAAREAACRSTWPSTVKVTERAKEEAARLAKRASTSSANRHEWLCPRRSGAASASVNESVAAPSGRVAGNAFRSRRFRSSDWRGPFRSPAFSFAEDSDSDSSKSDDRKDDSGQPVAKYRAATGAARLAASAALVEPV